MGVQEVRCDEDGTESADDCAFLCGNGNADRHLQTNFFIYKEAVPLVRMAEFVSSRMSYLILTDC
jgi:hypothetical protein